MLTPKDAFLSLIADSKEFEIDYDADTNESGRQIDCSTFIIRGPIASLRDMAEAVGIECKREESLEDAIHRTIEAEND